MVSFAVAHEHENVDKKISASFEKDVEELQHEVREHPPAEETPLYDLFSQCS